MTTGEPIVSHSKTILDFVRRFPGRDDDEISRTLRIEPRQTVNLICRKLEAAGLVHRRKGPVGKVATFPTAASSGNRTSVVTARAAAKPAIPSKPGLTAGQLEAGGFKLVGGWCLQGGVLTLTRSLPIERGVYAFAVADEVVYVGVATIGIASRLHSYRRPGKTQTTNIRVGLELQNALGSVKEVDIYFANPPDGSWNGLTVVGCVGVEAGLIEAFHLPWNIRGTQPAITLTAQKAV